MVLFGFSVGGNFFVIEQIFQNEIQWNINIQACDTEILVPEL